MKIEKTILNNLFTNEAFARKTIPYLEEEYFADKVEKVIYKCIHDFIVEYNSLPTREAIAVTFAKKNISDSEYKEGMEFLKSSSDEDTNLDWLLAESEKFCQERAVYNAIMESIHIIDGQSTTLTQNAIPGILSEALSVSFNANIGHDYIEDSADRYAFYHQVEERLPFDLEFMNTITNGGVPKKTLNIIMASTGVGKSLFMCHHAANCLVQNKNVLYITCEMAEERIAERIDANLMDITIDSLRELPYPVYEKKMQTVKAGCSGKLIVKEYPTASANVSHFRTLLSELKLKKQFVPDVIFVDYLNICASARLKGNATVNSYTYIKAIAEELRGLAVEYDVPIFSATQVNRAGSTSTDIGLENTSESFGLPATADFMFALIATEELDENNQILVKQLKNRYNDTIQNRKFIIGVNRAKMKLTDVNTQATLVCANQTEDQKLGAGFDGKKFDNKFAPPSESFSDWKM